MDECLALADLGASLNLMPLFVWKKLSLAELTLTCMTLKLADRSITHPIDIAEDVSVKVGVFHFPADFVVVDFDADPRVPLILGRSFLKTGRALIDVYEGELTLRVGNKAITFNLDQTSRYSANYNEMSANRIDSLKLLGKYSPEESRLFSFLALEDDPTSPEVDPTYYDTDGDILLLEAILNIKEHHPEVELKDLPPHLEYAFLEGNDKFPIIIAKDLKNEEKAALIEFAKVMSKYGVTHRLATAYHPQTSGQVEESNLDTNGLYNLNKLVYGKSCHLPIELEHKAYWALKHANFDLKTAGDHRKLQLNELNELRNQAYENSLIYKEKTKKLHDLKRSKTGIFNVVKLSDPKQALRGRPPQALSVVDIM
ncbi:reverse transcriptase domain-containing protein [Tanacetum coccineum]